MKKLLRYSVVLGLLAASPAAFAENPYHNSAQQAPSSGGHGYGGGVAERAPTTAPPSARSSQSYGTERVAPEHGPSGYASQPESRSYGGGGERAPVNAPPSPRNFQSYGTDRPPPEHGPPGYASQPEGRPYGYGGGGYGGHESPPPPPQGDYWARQHYHDGGYRPPEGYERHEWRHGDRLPPVYYGRDYWIGNFWAFGLFAPPPDFVWIRVGGDALLINQDTGEVVQVEYGVFY